MKIETKTQIMAPEHHLPFEVVTPGAAGRRRRARVSGRSLSPKRGLSPVVPKPGLRKGAKRDRVDAPVHQRF